MLLFTTAILTCFQIVIGFIEMVNEEGSQDREFRLTCRQLSAQIAILEARFTSISNSSLIVPEKLKQFTDANFPIRIAMNQRCSGRNHCSFILHADCPGSKNWGPGQIFFTYACIPEKFMTRFCNLQLDIPEGGGFAAQGFIMSPGYPKFYVGQSKCRWRIHAPKHQRVEITLIDVSLSGRYIGAEQHCEDILSIFAENTMHKTCQEKEIAPKFISNSNIIDVAVIGRTGSLVPKRGVLIYYRAVECPTPADPLDGYLIHRNSSIAEYTCCVGFVFPDTLTRTRTLRCLYNRWDQQLPSECINLQNQTRVEEITNREIKMSDYSHLVDIVIPSVLIAGLLIGNAIIVFIIYRYKQRKNRDIEEEEEIRNMVSENAAVP